MTRMVRVPRLSSVVPRTPTWRWIVGIAVFVVAYVPVPVPVPVLRRPGPIDRGR